MPAADLVYVHSATVTVLIASTQGPNMTSTGISLMTASESVTASQVQGALQPHGRSSTAIHIPSNAIAIKTNASVHRTLPDGAVVVANASPSLDINPPLGPGTGIQTTTAYSKSQNILPSGFTLSKGSAPTHGSGISIPVPGPHFSDTQPSIASDSLLYDATTMPTLSRKPSFVTISGKTATAYNLSRYSIDNQLLTKGAVTTVSGPMISLAPSRSDVVRTSTGGFGPSATVNVGSGSNGTEVQRFSGNALGAREGLWSSSTIFLVFFLVLLWL